MSKPKLTEWTAEYLRINREVSTPIVRTLYQNVADTSLSAAISKLRKEGWTIEHRNGIYVLISEPFIPRPFEMAGSLSLEDYNRATQKVSIPVSKLIALRDWLNEVLEYRS